MTRCAARKERCWTGASNFTQGTTLGVSLSKRSCRTTLLNCGRPDPDSELRCGFIDQAPRATSGVALLLDDRIRATPAHCAPFLRQGSHRADQISAARMLLMLTAAVLTGGGVVLVHLLRPAARDD